MPIKKSETFNLFAYGTLMNPAIFSSVLGYRLVDSIADMEDEESLLARRAILSGYKTISPDNSYLYAVPDTQGRIRGFIIGPIPKKLLDPLKKYEGKNYTRRTVTVNTENGLEKAIVFTGNLTQMEHSFGYAFHDEFKQEILLHKKIDIALLEKEQKDLNTSESFTRRAVGELHGSKIRDLMRKHFDSGGISDYVIRHSLLDAPLPDFSRIACDPAAMTLSRHYLGMVIRQVMFNQTEERIHREFHYDLEQLNLGKAYYDRTISALATLRILNSNAKLIDILTDDCMTDLEFPTDQLVKFVRWAIMAADSTFSTNEVRRQIRFMRNNMGRGHIPLGAELEFSNIGHGVISDPNAKKLIDPQYDGFVFFRDFGLDVLTWKLGGHIDDHFVKSSDKPRRGFFEVALGNISIEENLSKPVTDDPWILNQLIHEVMRFYRIAPHSIHISMQLRGGTFRPVKDRPPSLEGLKCLFALGSDLGKTPEGKTIIKRLTGEEIIRKEPKVHMDFSSISKRHSKSAGDEYAAIRTSHDQGRYVQQYKFLRLNKNINYELVIMALKGFQLGLSPGTFMTTAQYETSSMHRKVFESLMEWGLSPSPLSDKDIEVFLGTVYKGLATEKRGKPAHSPAYVAWAINQLRSTLADFNRRLKTELDL